MQIALNRNDFSALFLLPLDLQRKGVFLWQLAEVAWRQHQALEVLDHLLCLSHMVAHVYVIVAQSQGLTVASHQVYDAEMIETGQSHDWPGIVAGSIGWARDFVATFEFSADDPWRTRPSLFAFWAYNQADYRRMHGQPVSRDAAV